MPRYTYSDISDKTIGRLSLYRRMLLNLQAEGALSVYSHQLAVTSGVSAAQVRRDMMVIGYTGTPSHGYDIKELTKSIGRLLDAKGVEGVALVGVGNLGRAIISYFAGRRPNLSIIAAFDVDPILYDRVIHGCHCYPLSELSQVITANEIKIGIITVPAGEAQGVADLLINSGVRGILNFAPVRLRVPEWVYVENMDVTMSLEKVAYFAREKSGKRELVKS